MSSELKDNKIKVKNSKIKGNQKNKLRENNKLKNPILFIKQMKQMINNYYN